MPAFPTLEAQPFNSAGASHRQLINLPTWLDPYTSEFNFYEDGTTNFDITSYRATGDSYFVDYENGSDSNDGLTLATAKKTVGAGVSLVRSGAREILTLVGGQRHYNADFGDLDDLSITIKTTDGTQAILMNGNEDDSANFSLVSNDMYVWAGAPVFTNVLDETQQNYYGKWLHLELRTSSADVSSLGGWYHDGADLYVKMPDNRAPDSNLRCLLGMRTRYGGTGNNIYLENIAIMNCFGLPSFQGVSNVYFYRCEFAYNERASFNLSNHSSAQAFFYFVECVGHSALQTDIWSVSEDNYLYLQDCVGCYVTPDGVSTNITTAHGNSCIVAVNSLFVDAEHNNCGDTSHERGVLYLCCRSYKTIAAYTQNSNYGSFKFENDDADLSVGIYIRCDDQGSVGGPSFLAQGHSDLLDNNFRDVTEFSGSNVDYAPSYVASNVPPTANAGAGGTVAAGVQVNVSGSASSDGDGTIVSYEWAEITSVGVSLSSTTGENISFTSPTANSQQTVTLQLTVTDDGGLTDTATVTFTVEAEVLNQPPTANAGPDQSVAAATQFTLDGTGSQDTDGTIVEWRWTQTAGDTVTLNLEDPARPTATSPSKTTAQRLTFQLVTVDDEGAASAPSLVNIDVSAVVQNDVLNIIDKISFTFESDGMITAFPGRANRETFRLKPSDPTGLVLDDGWFDFEENDVRRVEISMLETTGVKIISSDTDSITRERSKLHVRMGDMPIKSSTKEFEPTVSVFVGDDERGVVMTAPGLSGAPKVKYYSTTARAV